MKNFGEQFLHQKNQKLHTSPHVEHEQLRRKKTGESVSYKPAEKIGNWLEVLEKTHMGHSNDPHVLDRIKAFYHKEYVIKPEHVPESAFLLEQRIARQQGHGTVEITDEFREKKTEQIIRDQEQSLDRWITYLTSPDAKYPMWAKYWAFTSMLAMGKFEKRENAQTGAEIAVFKTRTKDTVSAFPPLNAQALAKTISAIESKVLEKTKEKKDRMQILNTSKKLDQREFQNLLTTENFSKIYAQFLMEIPEYSTEGLRETRGEWVKYPQGSAPDKLVKSLEGHPLEWCTANSDTARTQLEGGDFYVYYSINEAGKPVIPRLAIRMEGDRIKEVRGIAHDQNLDPYIGEVAEKKLAEFPDGKKYQKKSANMKRLTEIEEKSVLHQELTREDLRFLYEIDEKIEGFGYEDDPRIKELLEGRDARSDLVKATGFLPEEISLTDEEALQGNMKYHHGSLSLDGLTSAEGLVLPQSIGGDLSLNSLTSAEGLVLPQSIGGGLDLNSLTSAEGLVLPQSIGRHLFLNGLTSAEGLVLPQSINGDLYLNGLTSAEGLVLPQSIGGYLSLDGLTSAEGLVLPQSINGYLSLDSLTSAEGLVLPQSIGRHLFLNGLTSAEGLVLPQSIGGGLDLNSLTSAEGLVLPQSINGDLYLNGLTSAEGLVLPQSIGRHLFLNGLTSAEGLVLPQSIGRHLFLNGLTSAEGLVLPQSIGGDLYLNGLTSAEKKKIKKENPNINII